MSKLSTLLRRFRLLSSSSWRNSRQPFHSTCRNNCAVEESLILVEQCDRIKMIGLNRPSKRNALTTEMINALQDELQKFEEDEQALVGLLYGVGGNFCSGLDLEDIEASCPELPLIDDYCKKPIVACISGYAVAEGFDLAMACDIRVMEEQAVLGVYSRRFGVPMSSNAISRLVHATGLTLATDLILSGRPVEITEAVSRGLVTRHVPCGAARGEGLKAAIQLVKYPQAAMLADRAALYQNFPFSKDILETLAQERNSNLTSAQKEMHSHCKKFSEGIGRHGNFRDLRCKDKPYWMS